LQNTDEVMISFPFYLQDVAALITVACYRPFPRLFRKSTSIVPLVKIKAIYKLFSIDPETKKEK